MQIFRVKFYEPFFFTSELSDDFITGDSKVFVLHVGV